MKRALRACLVMLAIGACKGPSRVFHRAKNGAGARLDAASFHRAVRPALEAAGCASGACHGSNLIGMHLSGSSLDQQLRDVRPYVVAGSLSRSRLYTKALGRDHQGGVNLSQDQCEARVLAQWIRGGRPEPCPAREDPRIRAGTTPPAMPESLDALMTNCAEAACHGARARPLIVAPRSATDRTINALALSAALSQLTPSRSRLLQVLRGDASHARVLSGPDDPQWRAAFSWMTGERVPDGSLPSWTVFSQTIHRVIVRRGCAANDCHGGGDNPLTLIDNDEARADNYLRIVRALREQTFPSKPRNTEAHGGGLRLGGAEDCASRVVDAWIRGDAPEECPSPVAPDRAAFARVVQPSLEALTCHRCHGDGTGGFWFARAAPGEFVQRNYDSVVAHVDLEYPPASPVLFRVREDCMQAKMLAWVGRRALPSCTVRLSSFRGSFPSMDSRRSEAPR
jgi:hypothetical protein